MNKGRELIPEDDLLIKVSFALKVGDLIDSNIMQLLPLDSGRNWLPLSWGEMQKKKLRQLRRWHRPMNSTATNAGTTTNAQQPYEQNDYGQGMQQPAYDAQYGQPAPQQQMQMRTQQPQVQVQQAQFASFESPSLNQVRVQ